MECAGRNPHFTGRDGMLAELRRLHAGEGTLVVRTPCGLGEVGKTQLAIDYAHRFAADCALVWWIDAEQSVLIAEQLAALAARLHLAPGPGSPPRWSGCWPSCAAATAGY